MIQITNERRIGPFTVPRLAFGTMRLDAVAPDEIGPILDRVLDAGVSLIDTAPIYGVTGPGFAEVERRLGYVFAASPNLRERCVLVTKAGIEPGNPYNSSSATLTASCDASLARLQTDRIDLFLVHRPDNLAGHADVASALDGLVASGKVRAVGVSNYRPDQVRALRAHLDAPLVVNQIEVSAALTNAMFDGTLDQCEEIGIAPMAWSPLGGGAILSPQDERSVQVAAALDIIAEANCTSRDVAALGWLLAHPSGMVPLLGTTKPERVRAATKALDLQIERRHWYGVLEAALELPMP